MPFIRTYIPQDTSPFARESIVQGIHQALMDSIGMPSDELFNLVTGYAPGEFACSRTFNGVSRSDRVVVIDITLRRGRSDAMKGTPKPIVDKVQELLVATYKVDALRERIIASGQRPIASTPAAFTARLESDLKLYGEIFKAANIKIEQ